MQTKIELMVGENFSKQIQEIIANETRQTVRETAKKEVKYAHKEWLSQKEALDYLGIGYEIFQQMRREGLQVSELGTRSVRVSKSEINRFLKSKQF